MIAGDVAGESVLGCLIAVIGRCDVALLLAAFMPASVITVAHLGRLLSYSFVARL